MEKNMQQLNMDELNKVVGGADNPVFFNEKRKEFDEAWVTLDMESKGYSGMRKSEMFEDWQSGGKSKTALEYLSDC